jgi:hypothetical protein
MWFSICRKADSKAKDQKQLEPILRETLHKLKAQTDEENRIRNERRRAEDIQKIIKEIYSNVIKVAKTSVNTSYKHECLVYKHAYAMSPLNNTVEIYEKHMPDIVDGIRLLFPDSTVSVVGTMVRNRPQKFISVNWS